MGDVVILYTAAGGTRAVSQTQKHQMVVMLGEMVVAFVVIVRRLPASVSLGNAPRGRCQSFHEQLVLTIAENQPWPPQ
jgi:Na+/proline symporter